MEKTLRTFRHLLVGSVALLCAPARAADAPDAATLFHNYCSVCHGERGDGKSRAAEALSTPPRDFTSAAAKRELSRERIVAAITHGRPGTAMVAWTSQLSAADIERVADHVYRRFVQGAAAVAAMPAPADMAAGLPDGLKGDVRRGAAFYAANCVVCHGERGDGAGPRAYFIRPKPRNFLADDSRSRFNRVLLFAAVSEGKVGTEMPAWRHVASAQQRADVAEYVFQAFVRAPAAAR